MFQTEPQFLQWLGKFLFCLLFSSASVSSYYICFCKRCKGNILLCPLSFFLRSNGEQAIEALNHGEWRQPCTVHIVFEQSNVARLSWSCELAIVNEEETFCSCYFTFILGGAHATCYDTAKRCVKCKNKSGNTSTRETIDSVHPLCASNSIGQLTSCSDFK